MFKKSNTKSRKNSSVFLQLLQINCTVNNLAVLEIRPTSACTDIYIYYLINSVVCYMFLPCIVTIFREMFFEGYIT